MANKHIEINNTSCEKWFGIKKLKLEYVGSWEEEFVDLVMKAMGVRVDIKEFLGSFGVEKYE